MAVTAEMVSAAAVVTAGPAAMAAPMAMAAMAAMGVQGQLEPPVLMAHLEAQMVSQAVQVA